MESNFTIRLREARLMRQFSMKKLSELTGSAITKQSISRYEKGIMHPKQNALAALSRALGISEAYLNGCGVGIDLPALRASTGCILTEEQIAVIDAKLSFWAERYIEKERRADCQTSFVNPLQNLSASTIGDVQKAADILREQWRCGDGPINSVLRLMDRKGIKILLKELTDNVLGLSSLADNKHPLIVIDNRQRKTTTEQIRFTACHELAHLLLSFPADSALTVEKRCNIFASFFLFPKGTFVEEMGAATRSCLTLDELTDLKTTYGISVAAQVHEAWDIGMISRKHYDWWYDGPIRDNIRETGWGAYPLPETIGREHRIDSRIKNEK